VSLCRTVGMWRCFAASCCIVRRPAVFRQTAWYEGRPRPRPWDHIVLHGDPAHPNQKREHSPQFSADVCCGKRSPILATAVHFYVFTQKIIWSRWSNITATKYRNSAYTKTKWCRNDPQHNMHDVTKRSQIIKSVYYSRQCTLLPNGNINTHWIDRASLHAVTVR